MILLNSLVCNFSENKSEFSQKVEKIAFALGVEPEWLMLVFYLESGLNSKAVNKQPGDSSNAYTRAATRATGLIQFMPDTARSLGTSNQALFNMNAIAQLDYVYKYFAPFSGRLNSFSDMYVATFFPNALGKGGDFILQTSSKSATIIAAQNPAYDLNRDRKITLSELKQAIMRRVPAAYLQIALKKKNLV